MAVDLLEVVPTEVERKTRDVSKIYPNNDDKELFKAILRQSMGVDVEANLRILNGSWPQQYPKFEVTCKRQAVSMRKALALVILAMKDRRANMNKTGKVPSNQDVKDLYVRFVRTIAERAKEYGKGDVSEAGCGGGMINAAVQVIAGWSVLVHVEFLDENQKDAARKQVVQEKMIEFFNKKQTGQKQFLLGLFEGFPNVSDKDERAKKARLAKPITSFVDEVYKGVLFDPQKNKFGFKEEKLKGVSLRELVENMVYFTLDSFPRQGDNLINPARREGYRAFLSQ